MKYFTATLIMLTAISFSAYAGDCDIKKASDVLQCALSNNTEIVLADSNKQIANANKKISGRLMNPSLEAGVAYNMEEADNNGVELNFAIMQTIEAPGKRKARMNRTSAEYNFAELTLEGQKELVTVQILTTLNRMRQIEREKAFLNKASTVFNNVIKSYKTRPVLSPEDEISLNLFQSVLNNYKLENNQLTVESNFHLNNLRTLTNQTVAYSKNIFFYPPQKYPSITSSDISNSVDLQKENVNIAIANAYLQDQKSYNFTDFSIGPYIETSPNVQSVDIVGVRLTVPIPVYSNKVTSEAGQVAVSTAKYKYNAKKTELDNTFKQLKTQYEQGIALMKGFNIDRDEQLLLKNEKLFRNGRISSSLLIESHRQMIDSMRLYHQYELETLKALWQLYAMQRKLISNINEVSYEKN